MKQERTQETEGGGTVHLEFELPKESWSGYLEDVTKNLPASEVVVEVISEEIGDQVEANWLPFRFFEYDPRDDVFEVAVGGRGPEYPVVLRHFVHHPVRLWVDEEEGILPSQILVEDREGTMTLVRIRQVPALES